VVEVASNSHFQLKCTVKGVSLADEWLLRLPQGRPDGLKHLSVNLWVVAKDTCVLVEGPRDAYLIIVINADAAIDLAFDSLGRLWDKIDDARDWFDKGTNYAPAQAFEDPFDAILLSSFYWLHDKTCGTRP